MECTTGGVQVLCDVPDLPPELWGQLLSALLKTLNGREEEQEGAAAAVPEEPPPDRLEDLAEDSQGYAAAFAQLHNAAAAERDPVPDVPDAQQYLAKSLAQLSQVGQHRILKPKHDAPCDQFCRVAGWPILKLTTLERRTHHIWFCPINSSVHYLMMGWSGRCKVRICCHVAQLQHQCCWECRLDQAPLRRSYSPLYRPSSNKGCSCPASQQGWPLPDNLRILAELLQN
jgi:hypothetical protein